MRIFNAKVKTSELAFSEISDTTLNKGKSANLLSRFINIVKHLHVSKEVWKERQALSRLSEHQLRDIGVHPATAKRESQRSYFDIPDVRKLVENIDKEKSKRG